ncbi:hypothetical protein HCN_0219 [Helicobacter cinaedi PAGU611]|uniref:Uncharacterized protein n=1 Tax=Helicobacter cinaedi CCUG 18818 = ATCC BAA-847 TaxID=537971 RepID=A0AAI8MKP8_9HELI|nr:hypothetical protein [Helicobacter cinaedi]AWK61077.1 hypothetical protein C6B36_01025 [Helicobacter cinaedi]QOQ90356.1 hypothetical protein HW260_08940 [Helicobacter cinaedi]QOQ96525.1 hypothetical protein HW245_02305 [Helicobacter cinaedi]BAM11542.1 hypothetical protein HCN_0219 [Helicobacter cinaedi PAGU611]BAM31475.1 hypothetical protein HCBAA847_0225 [Helicobacter cinaedi CCUG 18818 = ATCC BAA-847]
MNEGARFDLWNITKQSIHKKTHKKNIQPRRIYWVAIGQNIGSEIYEKILLLHALCLCSIYSIIKCS